MTAIYDEELVMPRNTGLGPGEEPESPVAKIARGNFSTPYVSSLEYNRKILEDRAVRRLMAVARRHGVDSPEVHRALRVWESIIYGDEDDQAGS